MSSALAPTPAFLFFCLFSLLLSFFYFFFLFFSFFHVFFSPPFFSSSFCLNFLKIFKYKVSQFSPPDFENTRQKLEPQTNSLGRLEFNTDEGCHRRTDWIVPMTSWIVSVAGSVRWNVILRLIAHLSRLVFSSSEFYIIIWRRAPSKFNLSECFGLDWQQFERKRALPKVHVQSAIIRSKTYVGE